MAYVTSAIKVNKSGRTYHKGKPLSMDVRQNVIDKLMQGKTYADISKDLGIAKSSVRNIVKLYNQSGDLVPVYQHNRRDLEKVSFGDSVLLETIVGTSGITSLEGIQRELELSGDCGRVSLPTISRHIRNALPSGNKYTRKRVSKLAQERFTEDNIIYAQLYIDYIHQKDPMKIKFFDESGFRLPEAGLRHYEYAPSGLPCVEIQRYMATPNLTLNFPAGLDGVKYANTIDGATNTIEFLRFFEEAVNAVDPATGRPALEVDDLIIVDNLPAHHGEAETALNEFLNDMSMELIYLPVYSPDLNPVEECFSKMKYLLRYRLRDLVHQNLELAVLHAIQPEDLRGYFRHTSYIDV